jgi:hypothetical protein
LIDIKESFIHSLPFAKMIGSFAFIWKLISNILFFHTKRVSKLNGFIAGAIASLSLLFESRENRVIYIQQLFMRSMQAGKNAMKYRNIPTVPHGDSIIFAFSCASILYAYGFYPDTLPKEYYSWMLKKSMVSKQALNFLAQHCANQDKIGYYVPVDSNSVQEILKSTNATAETTKFLLDYIKQNNGAMPGIPCNFFHPITYSCSKHCSYLWLKIFYDMIPVYSALTITPLFIFKFRNIIAK